MTARQCLLFLALLTGAWGLYLRPCYLDLKEHTGDFPITCHDVRPHDQVLWQYQHEDGSALDIGFCNPKPEPCVPKLDNFMSISRPFDDRSILVVKNTTRFLFSGVIFTCITFANSNLSDKTSCRMDVIRAPDSVSIRMQGSLGSLTLQETPGQSLTIDCVAGRHSCPSLALFQNGLELKREENGECAKRNSTSLLFKVMTVCQSTGVFSCVASNSAGQIQARSNLDVQCAPRKPTFFVERNRDLWAERNVTIDVIANPSPTTFEFQRLGPETSDNATYDREADDFLSSSCSRVGASSQHVCTVFTTGQITGDLAGEYGLDIGKSVGKFRFTFLLNRTVGSSPESLRGNHQPESSASLTGGVAIAVFTVAAVVVSALVVAVVLLSFRLRRVQRGSKQTSPKIPRSHHLPRLHSLGLPTARTHTTAASVANPSENYISFPASHHEDQTHEGPPSYPAPELPAGYDGNESGEI